MRLTDKEPDQKPSNWLQGQEQLKIMLVGLLVLGLAIGGVTIGWAAVAKQQSNPAGGGPPGRIISNVLSTAGEQADDWVAAIGEKISNIERATIVAEAETTTPGTPGTPGGGGGGGGGGAPADGEEEVVEEEDDPLAPPEEPVFPDLDGHWAEDDVNELVRRGMVTGFDDGTFRPDAAVTRAEFTVLLSRSLELTPLAGAAVADALPYSDAVPAWAAGHVAAATAADLVEGFGDGTFRPEALINREQVALIISRATSDPAATGAAATFTDAGQISSWAAAGVARASQLDIVTGFPDGSFRPQGTTTRAEAAVMLLRLLHWLETDQ